MSSSPPLKVRKVDVQRNSVNSSEEGASEECSADECYSRHHCDICKQLTFALDAMQCCECGLFLCQHCSGDFMISDDEADYCAQGFLNDSDYHCYRCLIKTPSAWCRKAECDCSYNISSLLRKVFDRNLAFDLIPGGRERAQKRLETYETTLEEIGDDPLEELSNKTLQEFIRRMPGYASTAGKKSELVERLKACLEQERKFAEQQTRT